MFEAAGGGFEGDAVEYGTQQFSSPAPEAKKSGHKIDNLLPLTIKTVLGLDENNQEYRGSKVNMINVMGRILQVEVTSTKVIYTVEDTTGTIPVIKWLDSDVKEETLMENTYCKVYGTMKSYQDQKQLLALHIEAVTDFNWITSHILEVICTDLKLRRLKEEGVNLHNNSTMEGSSDSMPNSMVNFGSLAGPGMPDGGLGGVCTGGYPLAKLTPKQKMVLELIQSSSEDDGQSRDFIRMKLKGKMTQADVDDQLNFLSSEGHVFTTVDEDHFKATDS